MQEPKIDGAERVPSLGISVLVVGGGVAGLLTALECWRKGMNVAILERAKEISPIGDFFTIPPSGMIFLNYYQSMFEEYHRDVYDCSISIWTPKGECVKKTYPEWRRPGALSESATPEVQISFIKQRRVFTKMLLDQVLRLGIPIHFDVQATSYIESADTIVVETKSGAIFEADVCVAADGIGSHLDTALTGEPKVLDSGYAIARAAFPSALIPKDSPAYELLKAVNEEPEFRTYLSDDVDLIVFLTNDHVAFAYTHESEDQAAESWNNLRQASEFIDELENDKCRDWDPAVLDFLRHVPGDVVDWSLRWRDPLQQWTSPKGRMIKVGDSAHAFLPTAGNGAVQACEDATSLTECLRIDGRSNIAQSTRVHNALRFQRVSILRQSGFINREELHHADLDEIAKQSGANDIGFFKIGKWVWSHDPELYARERYNECAEALKEGKSFVNTDLPPGHVFRLWTTASENERMASGKPSDLKKNGYWGI